MGLLWQVPEDEMLAAFLSIGAQGKPSLLDSGTTFPGPREGDLGSGPPGVVPSRIPTTSGAGGQTAMASAPGIAPQLPC